MLEKVTFSSDGLPPALDDRARFDLWRDIHTAEIASLDYAISGNMPFAARLDALSLGAVSLGEMSGTVNRAERSRSNIAEDSGQGHCLFINTGASQMGGTQRDREFVVDPGAAVLISNSEPVRMFGGDSNVWRSVVLPQSTLAAAHAGTDDVLALTIGRDNEALGMLLRYSQFLQAGSPILSGDLMTHAADTLVDLVALASGIKGRDQESGDLRGLRAARLAAILDHVRTRFADPLISAQTTATALGLSARYVHDILQESGVGFSERVQELRLQQARKMLGDPRYDRKRIGEIALMCGFGDVSHFNRSFRRRFGCTPTSAR